MKKDKPFVKGEHVVACTSDPRQKHEKMIVTSIGKKYITCKCLKGDDSDETYDQAYRFGIDNLIREDWSIYTLFHSIEDYNKYVLAEKKTQELIRGMQYQEYSLEELLLFDIIHKKGVKEVLDDVVATGVDKWIDQNLTI